MNKNDLLNLIKDDDLGLLSVKPKNTSIISSDERLIASFLEINNFIKEHNREPELGKDVQEHQLASRLKSLRDESAKTKVLLDFDEFNLLNIKNKEIKTIKDIFDDEDFEKLNKIDKSLFQITNVPNSSERMSADFIARRKRCKDFYKYEKLFVMCQNKIKSGEFKLKKLEKHEELHEGSYFVLGGILGLIVKTFRLSRNDQDKLNGRLYIVFENGTESNMLLQSLIKSMQDLMGRIVIDGPTLLDYNGITDKDKHSGYIYVLRSLSENQKIKIIPNLFKIGYSTTLAEERVKNASQEPAYLMAPVKIVTTFECYNFNPQKLEQLLHNFFGASCLNIDIFDANNKRFMPREWFIAPLEVIEKVVELVINGEIINYKYSPLNQKIILR